MGTLPGRKRTTNPRTGHLHVVKAGEGVPEYSYFIYFEDFLATIKEDHPIIVDIVATVGDLPTINVPAGKQVFVQSVKRIYTYDVTGWQAEPRSNIIFVFDSETAGNDIGLQIPVGGVILFYHNAGGFRWIDDEGADLHTIALTEPSIISRAGAGETLGDLIIAPIGGSSTGGHAILDPDETVMPTRDALQFGPGMKVVDDPVNERTIATPSDAIVDHVDGADEAKHGANQIDGLIPTTNITPTAALKFDKNYWPDETRQFDLSGGNITLSLDSAVTNIVGFCNFFDVVADGIHSINLGTGFKSNGIFPSDLDGKVLEAGTYLFFCIYSANGIVINSPAATGSVTPVDAPYFVGFGTAGLNGYIDVYFNEGVWGSSNSSTPVDVSDFLITLTNNGNISGLSILSATKIDNTALVGGEQSVRLNLSIDGTPNGSEVFDIKSISNSVFNIAGIAMDSTATTGNISLNSSILTHLTFNGIDQKAIKNAPSPQLIFGDGTSDKPFSISLNIKFNELGIQRLFAALGNTTTNRVWMIRMGTGGDLVFRFYTPNGVAYNQLTTSAGVINDNNEHQIIITYKGTGYIYPNLIEGEIYVDGSLVTATRSGNPNYETVNTITDVLEIGAGQGNFLNVSVFDFACWDTQLLATDVTEMYNSGSFLAANQHSKFNQNCISHWGFNGNANDTKQLNNLTLVGAPIYG